MDLDQPVPAAAYAVVDIETTGFRPGYDRIVSERVRSSSGSSSGRREALMRAFLPLALFALLSCVEDGTKELGESCWEEADCAPSDEGPVQCDSVCRFLDFSREQGESCAYNVDCVGALLCLQEVCAEGGGGGGGDDGGGGGYIVCNDGTRSPSCTACDAGCCSTHGGCL